MYRPVMKKLHGKSRQVGAFTHSLWLINNVRDAQNNPSNYVFSKTKLQLRNIKKIPLKDLPLSPCLKTEKLILRVLKYV